MTCPIPPRHQAGVHYNRVRLVDLACVHARRVSGLPPRVFYKLAPKGRATVAHWCGLRGATAFPPEVPLPPTPEGAVEPLRAVIIALADEFAPDFASCRWERDPTARLAAIQRLLFSILKGAASLFKPRGGGGHTPESSAG